MTAASPLVLVVDDRPPGQLREKLTRRAGDEVFLATGSSNAKPIVGRPVLSAKLARGLSCRRVIDLPMARCLRCPVTMRSLEATKRASELRRYSRQVGPLPVVLETRDGWLRLPLIDLSPGGAKVRLMEPLKEGTKGRLYFLPPHWRPRAVEAIVWRVDLDGVVLLFTGASITPPPAAHEARPPDAWLWTWRARAPWP